MAYTRDPDHYTRGVGAVQAVDKVLSQKRALLVRRHASALESARRDRLRLRLTRPALGAANLTGVVKGISVKERPQIVQGGVVEGGLNPGSGMNTGTVNIGGGGGGGAPKPLKPFTVGNLQTLVRPPSSGAGAGGLQTSVPYPGPGTTTVIVDPVRNPPMDTSGGSSGGVIVPIPPTSVGTQTGSGGGGSGSPTMPPDYGGGGGGGGGVTDDGELDLPSVTGPDYKKYAMIAGGALALFLLYKNLKKGR